MSNLIVTRIQNNVAVITLNRPSVLNALNKEMSADLLKALCKAEEDTSVRCLVVTGAGRAFCAGQDLAEVADGFASGAPVEFGERLREYYNPVIARLRTMEKPVIGSINGVAAGGGAGLALACDVRIAAESASFIQAFVNVGLVPDCGCMFTLPKLVGLSRAMELAFTGRKVESAEALQIGLVNKVVPDEALAEATQELAETLARLPTRAIGLTKRGFNQSWTSDLPTQLACEAMLQATAGQTDDHREGVMAFLEKRPPRFKGC